MPKAQRDKGMRGERELFALLSDELGIGLRRNLQQTRDAGGDNYDVAGWCIECKRHESLAVNQWWQQAVWQAKESGRKPILFYRQSRQPWRAVVALSDVNPAIYNEHAGTTTMLLPDACALIRASLQTEMPV